MEIKKRSIPMEELYKVILLQLENGGRASLTVTGRSMRPLFRGHRDKVELIPVDGKQKKGKIILYRRTNGQFVLHRIVKLRADGGYICCGDNQCWQEPVDHSQLLAVVDGFTRKGKQYSLRHFGYRLYSALWVHLFFLRTPYIRVRRLCGRLYSKIFNKVLK